MLIKELNLCLIKAQFFLFTVFNMSFFINRSFNTHLFCPSVSHSPLQNSYMSLFLSFGNDFGLNLYFLNFLNFYFLPRLITTPHDLYIHITYIYSFLYIFLSHDHIAKRSHYHIMIFLTLEFYSMDAPPPSFSFSSSTPPPLYSPSISL